jgi:purine-nucleoside/S-methyl-5'-thioadenosine phosphorylase / adenosine deaminase
MMITLASLSRDPAITHAFFTRRGGFSGGHFESLNCGFGSGDAMDNVARNRAVAMEQLGLPADRLVTCYQFHSATVIAVEEPWSRAAAPRGDGLVTNVPEIALGILAADCAPILLADSIARVIGAAHGGWRGALGGILEATIARMEVLGAQRARIRAGIGPCIAKCSYEVGPEFPYPFLSEDPAGAAYFSAAARTGHFMFDLPGYIEHRLARAGVSSVERAGHDTVAEDTQFFSYRRACLRGEQVYGRALSAIALRD